MQRLISEPEKQITPLQELKKLVRIADSPAGTFVICLMFSLAMIYHFVVPLNAILASDGKVWNDPAHSIWSLWLVNENVTRGRSPYHTDLIFHPVGANLAHHTLSPGFFPITFLVKKFSGNSPMYPVYAYRIIVWLCFTLLLYFSYWLLRELQFTRWAAAIGGVGFGFADFFMEHSPHLSLLSGFFIPLCGLLLVRLYRRPGFGAAIAASLSLGLAIYFTELALYIVLGLFLLLLAACLIRSERVVLFEKFRTLGWRNVALALALSVAIMTPFLMNHFSSEVTKPLAVESSNYSANLPGFVVPEPHRTPLYGEAFASLSARLTKGSDGRETFLGFPILLFAIIGLVLGGSPTVREGSSQPTKLPGRQKMLWASAAVALVFMLLSLGPTLKVFGTETGISMPYALLMKIPPFHLGRTPVRFVVMAIFFLMIPAAAGITWTQEALRVRMGRRWSLGLMFLILAWTVAESYWPFPRQPSFAPPSELAHITNGPVLNLPASRFDGYAALLEVFHHQPIATGYISRFSDQQITHVDNLARLVDQGDDEACGELTKRGIRNIILNPVPFIDAPYDFSRCALNVIDLRRNDAVYARYEIGTRIDFASSEADRFLGYGWSAAEPGGRWTDRGRAIVGFNLAHPGPASLRLSLAPFLVAGKLEQQRLAIWMNGKVVSSLTLNRNGVVEYSIPLPADLPVGNNLLMFELPDAESPKSLGVSEDARRLGINVQFVEINPRHQDQPLAHDRITNLRSPNRLFARFFVDRPRLER